MMHRAFVPGLGSAVSVVAIVCSLAGCSADTTPPATVAGTGAAAISGGAAVAGQPSTAGIGMMPSPVGAAGMGAAGTGAGGTGAAGTGAAGMAAAGTGAAGIGAAGMGAAGAPSFVPGSPTFSAIYQEIFVGTGCNGGPTCHASMNAGQLKMTVKADTYKALVGSPAAGINLGMMSTAPNCKDSGLVRVVAGDPAASLLYKKVSEATPACGMRMPPSGMLDAAKADQIRMWIMAGAKDD